MDQRRAAIAAAGLNTRIVDVEAFRARQNAFRKLMTHQMPDGVSTGSVAVVDFPAPAPPRSAAAQPESCLHA
ncbi:MAG: hypothetical protein IPM70_18710 [Proteobacteria bacterium]|nr:hypothetical protein [Pseudomonadota bacterium]